MLESVEDTAEQPTRIVAVVRVDDDDPHLEEYSQVDGVELIVGPRVGVSAAFNECGIWAAEHADILMMAADDIRFRTPGWDTMVRQAFDEDAVFVYGRDGAHDQNLGTHGFIPAEWVHALGFYIPPSLYGDYSDVWLHQLGAALGRDRYLPEMLIEHLHWVYRKAPMDATYSDRMDDNRLRARPAFLELVADGTAAKALELLRDSMCFGRS